MAFERKSGDTPIAFSGCVGVPCRKDCGNPWLKHEIARFLTFAGFNEFPLTFLPMSEPTTSFPATRWTLLQTLREGSADEARAALETLCQAYWFPLYVVARRKMMSQHDAEDAVQGFFLSLLRREVLVTAEEKYGRLRTLLLTAFENYCKNEWRKLNTAKRGGGVEHINLMTLHGAETRYLMHGGADGADMETLYNREWARAVLERSLERLKLDHERRMQSDRFDLLVGHLTQKRANVRQEDAAREVGMNPNTYRQALHRMRQEYREKIERELAVTLDTNDPEVIKMEMFALLRAFE